ncbi:MAG: hypothetical protein ACK5LC_02310 [Coprobacillaceae bacterium]
MKKICTSVLTLGVCLVGVLTTSQAGFNWEGFRAHNNIVALETPITSDETVLDWSTDITTGYDTLTNPIVVDDYIYAASATNNQLVKMDKNGNIVDSVTMDGSIGYNGYIAYGDGKIFVCEAETLYDSSWNVTGTSSIVQAFDINTLTSVWVSEELGAPGSYEVVQSPIVYHNGYVYVGTANPSLSSGSYIAITTSDENTAETNEVKDIAWQYTPSTPSSYSWSGGCVVGDTIVFVNNVGELTSCSLTDGTVLDVRQLNHPVSSSIVYDDGYLYFGTKDGWLIETQYESNTTFGGMNKIQLMSGGSITGTPTVYEGKIYLGGAVNASAFDSKGFVMIIDANTYHIDYQAEVDGNVQSSMLVNTYYDGVYAYFTQNTEIGGVYCLAVENGEASVREIYKPAEELQNYCITSLITDGDVLYHSNDSGNIMALSKAQSTSPVEPNPPVDETPTTPTTPVSGQNEIVKTGDVLNIGYPILGLIVGTLALKKQRK